MRITNFYDYKEKQNEVINLLKGVYLKDNVYNLTIFLPM